MNPPPAAFNSNALALVRKPPDRPRHLDIQRVPHGPGLSLFQVTTRLGKAIKPVVDIFRPRPDLWRSRIEELFGNDDAREKALDELNQNPNCSSRSLKPLEGHCHELLKLARPEVNSVETQLITFKILAAIITRYPGIRRPLHAHKDLGKASATDPSLSSIWKRPHTSCDDEWIFYRNFAAFCISNNAFELTKLVEDEPPSRLSRVKLDGNLNKVPIETLLGHSRSGPEFHLSRLCAIRYLAGILELPSFWRCFPPNPSAERERNRFLDVLSDLCNAIIELIGDTEENAADMSVVFSPSMVAGRMAVDVLSCSVLNGLLRLRDLNNLPPRGPASLPKLLSLLLRESKTFPKAFEHALRVRAELADENLSSDADGEMDSDNSATDRASSPPAPEPSSPASVPSANAQEAARNNIIREMVETELKYVQDLEIMHKYAAALSQSNLIDRDHLLFLDLNKLLNFQRKFLIRLQGIADLPWRDQRWGQVFLQAEEEFSVYEAYCANYTNRGFQKLMLANEQNLTALNYLINVKGELPAFLIKPIQHVRKYPLLLDSLIEASSAADYQHYEELKIGSEAAKRIIDKINKTENLPAANQVSEAELREALKQIESEPRPATQEANESYFMSQVATGEELAARGEAFHLPAALSFYRALTVYPSPPELLPIYQKTVPEPIVELVLALMNLDVSSSSAPELGVDDEWHKVTDPGSQTPASS
ncbi:hypothetical protein B0H14DRAFT_3897477 [Mycena olivaceomarginata]|nr:hypothetical protein B0H14DRAFT_3897477 [Mycena olivaceomarginata]